MSETIIGIYCVNFRSISPIPGIVFFTNFFLSRGCSPLNLDWSIIPLSQADPMSCMPPRVNSSFFAFPTTPTEVQKIIMSLPNKSCNLNTVPVFIYKRLSLYTYPHLYAIFLIRLLEREFFLIFVKLQESFLLIKVEVKH